MSVLLGKFTGFISLLGLAGALSAAEFTVSVDIPTLDVAEYHRPYLAMWIAETNKRPSMNLGVLYDIDMADDEGEKWLKDLRQWWRRSGRSLDMPVDGISGATRPPARHDFDFSDKLGDLAPGDYLFIIEVVREVGGRELLEIPFRWPAESPESLNASGETELGRVVVTLAP